MSTQTDQTEQDYLSLVDEKKQELEEQQENENPEGRCNWYQLVMMQRLLQKLGNRQFEDADMFATKLSTNGKEVKNWNETLRGVMPQFEDQDKAEEYQEKINDLRKEYAGVSDLSQYNSQEIMRLIGGKDKKDALQAEIELIKDEYPDIVETIEKQNDFKAKFLAKCEFDKITKQDLDGTGLTKNELDILDPMLDL